MKNLSIAVFVYVGTFEKLLGQHSPAARRAREGVIDQLLAAAFEALEASVSVHREVDAGLIDMTYGAGTEMGQLMMMAGQDGFGRGDLPEDISAGMLAEAREYLLGASKRLWTLTTTSATCSIVLINHTNTPQERRPPWHQHSRPARRKSRE